MASGSTAMLRRAAQDCLCQASAEHFQQCAEFPLFRNRGLGLLAVTVLPIPLARGRRYQGFPLFGPRLLSQGTNQARRGTKCNVPSWG